MKHLKWNTFFLAMLLFTSNLLAQEMAKNTIETTDVEMLLGEWTGTLTYIDYNSNEPYTMPCEAEISKKNNQKLSLYYKYPNEPKANSKGKIKIAKDQSMLNGKPIISRKILSDGHVEITTEYAGKDGNKREAALIRSVYIIGENTFIIRKEVKFNGTQKWIKRNEYNFVKK